MHGDRRGWRAMLGVALTACLPGGAGAVVVTFEDLSLSGSATYFNGDPGGLAPGDSHDGTFASGGVAFANNYAVDAQYGYGYWWGFAYSRVQNSTDGSWTNQYAAKPGAGATGSATYAVAYVGPAALAFSGPVTVAGFRVANTTYAYSVMTETDPNSFSTPLSATNGWLKLSVAGSLGGVAGTTVEHYLADFRTIGSPGASAAWSWLDLSALGAVDALSFSITGSDTDPVFGLNTPAYFAMDDLTYVVAVPEPATLVLVVCGSAALGWRARRGRAT